MDGDITTIALIAAISVIFGILMLVGLIGFFMEFTAKRRYIKMEIHRTDGMERVYWKRELRRHYLSIIPFVRFRQD